MPGRTLTHEHRARIRGRTPMHAHTHTHMLDVCTHECMLECARVPQAYCLLRAEVVRAAIVDLA